MAKIKYTFHIESLPKNCPAYINGNIASFQFSKHFGDNHGSGGPIKNKEDLLISLQYYLDSLDKFDYTLERDIKQIEQPNEKNTEIIIDKKCKSIINEKDIWNLILKKTNKITTLDDF